VISLKDKSETEKWGKMSTAHLGAVRSVDLESKLKYKRDV
jgi:hypothetical protein